MRISNRFFLFLTLTILAMVLRASADDTEKYEACIQTNDCKEYSSIANYCGVDADVDLTTPRLLSSRELLCLCLSGEFLKAISSYGFPPNTVFVHWSY